MIEFVFMLTHHDRTVPHAAQVLADLRGTGLRLVGCKDVGATPERLRDLVARAHDDGLEMMLEVVSTSRDDELASVRAAVDAGFDWVLGGTHAAEAADLLAGTGIRYCPFPGRIVGHPSVLEGEIDEIARSAAELTALDGVHGVDLLAYRHPTADVHALTAAVVAASAGPVIAAGSVVEAAQIETLAAAGAWGFTIGGAIFEGRLPGGPDVAAQVRTVLGMAAGA
jgi:uncharacterized protein related to proFAR isomerase